RTRHASRARPRDRGWTFMDATTLLALAALHRRLHFPAMVGRGHDPRLLGRSDIPRTIPANGIALLGRERDITNIERGTSNVEIPSFPCLRNSSVQHSSLKFPRTSHHLFSLAFIMKVSAQG